MTSKFVAQGDTDLVAYSQQFDGSRSSLIGLLVGGPPDGSPDE